ncbi:Phage tail length tape-measure protein [Desulfosporosinus sp. I2]|uniref:hypothetical protein n=1 Tax=Desulfosporosinus sp. I2 TaxID=1617025 RepID=UPI00061F9344|nr:hypothetical protein [Desulfosporosinus sp. I2]KJR48398.1 Phage tail length tape-measure protein [Desulfosporosinus sp. I2]
MNPYFKGGSEKLSQSGTGLMSTITGNLGSKVQDTGKAMLERLKPTLTTIIDLIDKYSPQMDKFGLKIADGIGFAVSKLPTLKKYLSDAFETTRPVISWVADTGIPKVRDILGSVLEKATGVYNFFKTNWGTLGPFITGIAIAFGTYKAVMMAMEVVTIAVTAAQLALNFAMNLNPMGLVIIGIGLLIGAGILLYKNWDTVKEKASDLWLSIENVFKTGVNGAIGLINTLIDKINLIPGVNIPLIARVSLDTSGNSTSDGLRSARGIDGNHANGLDYVPFDGYIAKLHKGERVQTASQNPYNGGGSSSSVVVHMNGTVVREEADVQRIANAIVQKLDAAAANM